jgi:hypothetical protein
MAVTITPEELYFGSPTTLTYGGEDMGGTTEPPTLSIEVTTSTPDFQNAAAPIVGTVVVTDILVSVELMMNQVTAAKLTLAMPGATETDGVITWTAGRVPSAAFKDLVLVGQGLDGRTMTVTLENALSAESINMPFSKTEFGGVSMRFVAHADAATPLEAPFSIAFSAGS